ncbi:MAG: FAD-dependent oxidoreductase [Holophagales bacterium]|nr:FAD-dependent oxidoreductase [Holophagales bacterium]MYG31398.1 FAD-dependent oxidoreductase [Holophagales bacterium]MYI81331.1 FAD-dependent oxidoreductase [Holophagales bacterium]
MARRNASTPGPDVLVVGGGLIGLLSARELALAGARVEVVDDRQEGAASPNAAGMIAPIAESIADQAFARISIRSRNLWRDLAPALERESGMSIDYDDSGSLLPVLDPNGRKVLDRIKAQALDLGETARDLDRAELLELVPDLRPGIEEALLLPGEHRVDNRLAATAAATALRHRNVVVHRATVERVAEAPGQVVASGDGFERAAGAVVVCGGAWTPRVHGLPALPIVPVKGQMIAFDGIDWPFTGAIRTPAFYAVRRAGGRLLIGASVEHAGFDLGLSDEVGADLAAGAAALLPALKDRKPVEHWAGLRPGTPDPWPIVGRLSQRLHVATGHFRNGILLAPLTARMIAPLVLDEQPDDPWLAIPEVMLPDRFSGAGHLSP